MSRLSLTRGRVKQKHETRLHILAAARELMKTKKKVNLNAVAAHAGVSRATVYRYFPSINLLYLEASLDVLHKSPAELNEEIEKLSLGDGISHIQQYYNTLALDHETAFRRYLASALNESVHSRKKIRGARRVTAFDHALSKKVKGLGKSDKTKLKNLASVLSGIDAIIACRDVCGLNKEESANTLEWGMEKILLGLGIS